MEKIQRAIMSLCTFVSNTIWTSSNNEHFQTLEFPKYIASSMPLNM